jgi:hypothetical protein
MTQVTNTFDSYDAVGIREDLSNVIENISPYERPFTSNIGRESVSNKYFEWQEDALATASTSNAVIEGDIATYDDVTPTVRYGNYTQIFDKTVTVSGTEEKVDKAGRSSELSYQLAKKGKELMNDVEATLCQNQFGYVGTNAAARKTAGFEAFIRTNDVRGTNGAESTLSGTTNGYPNAYPTEGTQAALTEVMLNTAIQALWTQGGTPKIAIMGPVNKRRASTFTGIAQIRKDVPGAEAATVIGAVDVYVSDFGNVSFVPSRFCRERSVLLVDPEYASVATLRPLQTWDLAKVGDAESKQMLMECGLKLSAEKAHAVIADLTTS